MFKNRFMDHARLILLFTIIYVILNEHVTVLTIGFGVGAGIVAILLTNKMLESDYVEMFHINGWLFLTYFWIIIRDTYTVGFDGIIRTLTGNIKPNLMSYESDLKDEFLIALLANAITMPPGAIVVDRDGNKMTIMTVGYDEQEFLKITHDKIEKLFKKFDGFND